MNRSPRPRTPASLSNSVHQRLNSYALAASAAGVGVLALAQPSEAKIIYKQVHVLIGSYSLNPAGEEAVPFYVAGAFSSFSTKFYWARVSFNPQTSGAKFVRAPRSSWSVAALPKGAVIDSKANWGGTRGLVATYGAYGGGTFEHHRGGFQFWQTAFVGFKFNAKGETHYGWARLSARLERGYREQEHVYALLSGYAYETIPGRPIKAGFTRGGDVAGIDEQNASLSKPASRPASLGMLARGAASGVR